MIQVYGDILDEETRCQHYHSERDIIALKCFACQKYYPCFLCHDRYEDHAFLAYPVRRSEDRVVLCGHCRTELTISQYPWLLRIPALSALILLILDARSIDQFISDK